MRKKRKIGIWRALAIFIIAVALTVGGFYLYKSRTTAAQAPEQQQLQTATVRSGDLVVSATGAGAVIPADELSVGFSSGGLIKELDVQVADSVTAGAVLARLDDASARSQVNQAELSLAQAQIQLAKLMEQPTAEELAAAQASLATAKANLESKQSPATRQEVAAAQQTLLSAQQKLKDLQAGPSDADLASAKADLDLAYISLQQAQAAYDPVSWRSDVGQLPQGIALQQATLTYEKAKAAYESNTQGATASELAAARASVAQAQSSLDTLKQGSTGQELVAAQAAVDQAQAQYDALMAGSDALDIQLAQIAVKQAENTLETAKQALADTVLTAPISGVVTAVSASAGERVGGTAFITLADLAQPLVEVYLDETDLDKAGLNYEAQVTFDALPDQTFTGHIVRVDPQLTTSNGATVVRAVVQLDPSSFAKPQTLPAGLNASVEVIGGRATQALLVPVEALREISTGQYAVFVVDPASGEPQLRMVEVGLMDLTSAEIKSGLKQGDVVTTGIVATGGNASSATTGAGNTTTGAAGPPPPDMVIGGGP